MVDTQNQDRLIDSKPIEPPYSEHFSPSPLGVHYRDFTEPSFKIHPLFRSRNLAVSPAP